MFDDPNSNGYWTQPAVSRPMARLASRFGLEYGDLLSETALRLLSKFRDGTLRLVEINNIIAYTIKIAQQVCRETDKTTLERKRRMQVEQKYRRRLAHVCRDQESRDPAPNDVIVDSELRDKIFEFTPRHLRPILHAWNAAPLTSTTTTVSKVMGVSQPTARRRIEELKTELRTHLIDYPLN